MHKYLFYTLKLINILFLENKNLSLLMKKEKKKMCQIDFFFFFFAQEKKNRFHYKVQTLRFP